MPDSVPESDGPGFELVHPVYLDTRMIISFVAALEGGVAYGDERTQRNASSTDRSREAGGRFGVPLLSSLLSLDMSGRLQSEEHAEGHEEIKVVRRHTEASLFNLLRHRLLAEDQVTTITSAADLESVRPGQLVEVSGESLGNPLAQLFDVMRRIMPYLGIDEDELRKPRKSKGGHKRSGNPAKRAQTGPQGAPDTSDEDEATQEAMRLLFLMRDDLDDATVRDLVMSGPGGVNVVLTLSTEFLSDQTTDALLGGKFRVLGKVTRTLEAGEIINLTRRTALGISGPDIAKELVNDFTDDNELFVELRDPIVEPPAMQVLPLALFV